MTANSRNWAHDPCYDQAALEAFEERLKRARAASRPGYLRVKGATLLEIGEADALPVAIGLLRRVVDEYDHFLEVPWAHELLGEAYQRAGDLASAEKHLRLCLETADDRRNGTSGVTELLLAEVLLRQDRAVEAGSLLNIDGLRERLLWNSHIFRYCLANARAERSLGRDPEPWARGALELAASGEPQQSRHPTVGVVKASKAELAELEDLASRPRRRRRARRGLRHDR